MQPYQKSSENWVRQETGCTRASAADTLDLHQVGNGNATVSMVVFNLWQMIPNRHDFIDARVKINDEYYREVVILTQKLMPVMRMISVASSLSPSKAMFLLIKRVRQSTFYVETPVFMLPDLLPPNSTDLNPVEHKNRGEMQHVGLAS